MSDLISREALKHRFAQITYTRFTADMGQGGFEMFSEKEIEDIIDNAPTVEAYPFEQVQELVKLNQQFAQEIENLKINDGGYTKGFADGERSGRNFSLADEEKAILVRQWRPKGEWIYDELLNNWKCSECGKNPKTIGYVGNTDFMKEHFKFCNHCGADMRKGGVK